MLGSVIDTYFSDIPTMLCAGAGIIAAENATAQAALPRFSQGHSLLSHMAPYDALRFETACDRAPRTPLSFPLRDCGGYTYAAAAFETLADHPFAAVCLFADADRCRTFLRTFPRDGARDATARETREKEIAFARIVTDCAFLPREDGLFDLRTVTQRVLSDLTSFCSTIGSDAVFVQNDMAEGSAVLPSAIGVGNYLRLLMSALAALDERSADGRLTVRLCQYGGEYELRLQTCTDLRGAAAVGGQRLSLCAFIAECCDVLFSAALERDTGMLTLVITLASGAYGALDLKSRDQFGGYAALFARTASLLRATA